MRYRELVQAVVEENRRVLEAVPEQDIERLVAEIAQAKTIQLYAMGRMQASMRGFAMRLKPMSSLLEQALFLFEDIVVMLLIERRGISLAEMQRRHTNLEGVMGEFA